MPIFAHPLSLYLPPLLELQYVAPSTPPPARLARHSYLYSNQSPPSLSPSLWFFLQTQSLLRAGWTRAERIELFIENQAFWRSYD
jgi:hypothetical protein